MRDARRALACLALAACEPPPARVIPSPDQVTIDITVISAAEADLVVTAGPAYRLERNSTEGTDPFREIATLPRGETEYDDYGQDRGGDTLDPSGLRASYEYRYRITVLGADGAEDPAFGHAELSIETYVTAVDLPPPGREHASATLPL